MRRYVSPLSKLSIDTKAGADGAAAAEADGMFREVWEPLLLYPGTRVSRSFDAGRGPEVNLVDGNGRR